MLPQSLIHSRRRGCCDVRRSRTSGSCTSISAALWRTGPPCATTTSFVRAFAQCGRVRRCLVVVPPPPVVHIAPSALPPCRRGEYQRGQVDRAPPEGGRHTLLGGRAPRRDRGAVPSWRRRDLRRGALGALPGGPPLNLEQVCRQPARLRTDTVHLPSPSTRVARPTPAPTRADSRGRDTLRSVMNLPENAVMEYKKHTGTPPAPPRPDYGPMCLTQSRNHGRLDA